jgi:hypothetical protein
MGRTACTEPQCLYSRAIPLLPLRAVRPVQSLSTCTRVHFTFLICKWKRLQRRYRWLVKAFESSLYAQPYCDGSIVAKIRHSLSLCYSLLCKAFSLTEAIDDCFKPLPMKLNIQQTRSRMTRGYEKKTYHSFLPVIDSLVSVKSF